MKWTVSLAPPATIRPRAAASAIGALAPPAALAGLALLARLGVGPLTVDDAYITFRYARNLVEGAGFVYNPGERVLGTTTPLWTLLLAGLHCVTGLDLPELALRLSALADALTTLVLFGLGRRLGLGRLWSALLAGLFALNPLSIAFATGGMESSLFVLLLVGAAAADATGRPAGAGLLAALATLARPEGALMGALVLGRHLAARHLPPRRALLAYLAPLLPWVGFATGWFGSPIPQSAAAKAATYQVHPLDNALALLLQLGLPGLSPVQLQHASPPIGRGVAFGIGLALLLLALALAPRGLPWLRRRPELWALVAFAPLLAAGYALAGLKGVRLFHWYVVPFVPFYLVGLVALLRATTTRAPRPLAALAASLLAAWLLFGLNLGREPHRAALAPLGASTVREDAYAAAGRYLAPRLGAQTVVALPEIGAFGYVSRARILDTVGLVSPEAVRFYPLPPGLRSDNAVPPELVRQLRPDYLVGLDLFLPEPLLAADWFQRQYRLIAAFDAPIWGARAVLVYERHADRPEGG